LAFSSLSGGESGKGEIEVFDQIEISAHHLAELIFEDISLLQAACVLQDC
jgi:hypothetical protein